MTGLSLKEECELRKKKEEEEAKREQERIERERKRRNREREEMDRRRESHSRERSFSRSRRSHSSERRGRSRSKDRGRRSRERSHERDRRPRVYRTDDPNTINCRVFIGNFPTNQADESETRELFSKYGRVLALSIHKNFAFVQFEKEDDARASVAALQHSLFKGVNIDVKMAAEGRKRKSRSRSPVNNFREERFRDETPWRERERLHEIEARERERDVRERDRERDRMPPRDPYPDRYGSRRDPYPDPYTPGPSVPPRPPRPADRPPFEVQIIIHSPQQRGYADILERRLRNMDLVTDILVVIEQETNKLLVDTTRRGVPYAIVLTPQNELHRSLTLNILHGTPQEHRNMPLEDAMSLISRNFQIFLRERQERLAKAAAPPPPPPVPVKPPPVVAGGPPAPEFVVPDKYTRYLLNLLADDRILTLEELDKLMDYLEERRHRYMQVKGGAHRINSRFATSMTPAPAAPTVTPSVAEKVIDQQQQQLQDRILSILTGGESSAALASINSLATIQQQQQPDPTPPPTTSGGAGLPINLDNPNIQKALDDLLQSGIGNLSSSLQDAVMSPTGPPPSHYQVPQPVPPPANYSQPGIRMYYPGY